MPRYDYYCEECDYIIEVIKPMEQSDEAVICPDCDSIMKRQYMGQNVGTPNKDYSRNIVSHSLAMCPTQIPEHNRMFPDIKVRADGVPVFDNFKKHDDYLKKVGITKTPQRNRKRGKVIKKGQ
jgi:putative FmdB family regulatory protein